MTSSEDAPEATRWRRAAKFYRRPLGAPWLIAAVAIPLLLGAIGYGLVDRNEMESSSPTAALPTLSPPESPGAQATTPIVPPVWVAPVSVVRNGDDITLRGEFPDEKAKTALLDAVIRSVGSNANIIDMLDVNPDVTALDFSDAEALFNAAAPIRDFSLTVNGDTVKLAGTAASTDQVDSIEQLAEDTWPNLNIVDTMAIGGPATPTGPSGPGR